MVLAGCNGGARQQVQGAAQAGVRGIYLEKPMCRTMAEADEMIAACEEHGVKLASGRAGNVIGGGDWAEDRLVPDLMRSFVAGKVVPIRNPAAIRAGRPSSRPPPGHQRAIRPAPAAVRGRLNWEYSGRSLHSGRQQRQP